MVKRAFFRKICLSIVVNETFFGSFVLVYLLGVRVVGFYEGTVFFIGLIYREMVFFYWIDVLLNISYEWFWLEIEVELILSFIN